MEPILLLFLLIIQAGISCYARNNRVCPPSACGEFRNLSYPFRLKDDPKGCGDPRFRFSCENNRMVISLLDGQYLVKSVDPGSRAFGDMVVVDVGLQKSDCSSLPLHQLMSLNFIAEDANPFYISPAHPVVTIVSCSKPARSPLYVNAGPCIAINGYYSYAIIDTRASGVEDFCTITTSTVAANYLSDKIKALSLENRTISYEDIHNAMADGFNVTYWMEPQWKTYHFCFLGFRYRGKKCVPYLYYSSSWGVKLNAALNRVPNVSFVFAHFVAAKFVLGAPCVLILLVYKWMRRHQAMDANIEEFLQSHNNFLPVRYSYSDIKKITKNFKYKLGEGGYGSVYKGLLRSGNEVAVKVLKKSKSDGQDFISEVATIGRIHHVNVVQLVGFCFDYSKQALVYDFMSNGSLDKHIIYKDGENFVDHKKMYEISIGIARGLDYLHRGCDMQILHFDIKPHNILLDKSFTPKISDFGLARLYTTDRSVVTLTAARGTLGYMAPELFYKNIGGVSFKADVYSFGMLLMEMAGRRRNINANAEASSQVYFPLWIYDQLNKEKAFETVHATEEERETARKMIIVALWCIQLSPNDRPSMSRVLNMLEGKISKLQLPPKPLLYPRETSDDHVDTEIELETFSSSSSVLTISNGYQHSSTVKNAESCFV